MRESKSLERLNDSAALANAVNAMCGELETGLDAYKHTVPGCIDWIHDALQLRKEILEFAAEKPSATNQQIQRSLGVDIARSETLRQIIIL